MSITTKITDLQHTLPREVTLVAISKTHPEEAIREAYEAGQRVFGENRPQEMKAKYEALPKDICWHMIGHLQTNKVRVIAPFVALIHSVDSVRLLELINSEAERCNRVIDVLLEVRVAREESKHGWGEAELEQYLATGEFRRLVNVHICGLMGMATYTDDTTVVHSEFERLHQIFQRLHNEYFANNDYFRTLSMGMSGDYPTAIEAGSTMVRIGSMIFGDREYK